MLQLVLFGAVLAGAAAAGYWFKSRKRPGPNPFDRLETAAGPDRLAGVDRNKVLKQRFAPEKVPDQLDAIVIGSGMGGLSSAAILAKAGKRVLVLEQHDQAGGCCHTFYEKGYEFDTGIHYIGEMKNRTTVKFLMEQISECRVGWHHLDNTYDTVVIGDKDSEFTHPKRFPIVAGRAEFRQALIDKFPDEVAAIDAYLALLANVRRELVGYISMKIFPQWFCNFLLRTGLIRFYTRYFDYANRTLSDVLASLTQNKDLRAVLAYSYGDYGTAPGEASFAMHATLMNHYLLGGSYPIGGPSEIPFRIIPVIERTGGRVLVNANVEEIIVEDNRATGVRLDNGFVINAPIVISTAGVFNTYQKLLPEAVQVQHNLAGQLATVQRSIGCFSLFVGLKGTSKELGLPCSNIWAFKGNDQDALFDDFVARGEATQDPPFMFISFPSAKDPTYEERCPGKACLLVISLAKYEWFEEWKDEPHSRRGGAYESLKDEFAKNIWKSVLQMYPHLEDKVEYFNLGTPLTNKFYLAQEHGETYGVDHNMARFSQAWLRPTTPIRGLYHCGQDIFTCGFAGAMFAGVLTTSSILNRNIYADLMKLKQAAERR